MCKNRKCIARQREGCCLLLRHVGFSLPHSCTITYYTMCPYFHSYSVTKESHFFPSVYNSSDIQFSIWFTIPLVLFFWVKKVAFSKHHGNRKLHTACISGVHGVTIFANAILFLVLSISSIFFVHINWLGLCFGFPEIESYSKHVRKKRAKKQQRTLE